MSSINTIQARPFQLAEPIGTTDTEITVKNFFDIYGNPIVMSGSVQFATLEPRSQDNQEIISYTDVVQLTTTQFKLIGITRGLDAQPDPDTGVYGSDPVQAKAHSANAEAILSDNPQVWDKKPSKDEDETITGQWSFDESPIIPTPTSNQNAATKAYVDTVAILGGADSSKTVKGISRLSESPNVALGAFTVTIATPAVFTKATHGLTVNDTVQFATDGALPTGLLSGTTYYVIAAGLTASNFQVSETYGGSAVATSGTQSGTHTITKTTPVAVGSNDTRIPTQSENDAMVGTSGTPSASNPYVTTEDPRFLVKPEYFPNNTYPAGEILSPGNAVFIESVPSTSQAINSQNLGDVTANTRVALPVFGTGISGNTVNMNVAKTGSPSVSLGVRIETDNGSGSPSGTLVDPNAIGTIAAASLSTDAFLGTATDTTGVTYSSATAGASNTQYGFKIQTKRSVILTQVVKDVISSAVTVCYLKSSAGATLATANFVGNIATFSYTLAANTFYRIECLQPLNTNLGFTSTTYPINKTNINYISGSNNGTDVIGSAYHITSISTVGVNDSTITMAGSFSIPAGKKCHAVVYAGTYGSETVNASNYYKIGFGPQHTTTRISSLWNGSVWSSSFSTIDETSSNVLASGGSDVILQGVKINVDTSIIINSITKGGSVGATRCLIKNDSGAILYTANFSGNIATFSGAILGSGAYRIECDSNGSTYSWWWDVAPPNLQKTYIKYTGGSISGADSPYAFNISSINVSLTSMFAFVSSSVISSEVISKTNSLFSYKSDWFGVSQETVSIPNLTTGKYPIVAIDGVDGNQTGMVSKQTMYLGNTPGSISATAGTIPKKIGKAISSSKIQLYPTPI